MLDRETLLLPQLAFFVSDRNDFTNRGCPVGVGVASVARDDDRVVVVRAELRAHGRETKTFLTNVCLALAALAGWRVLTSLSKQLHRRDEKG